MAQLTVLVEHPAAEALAMWLTRRYVRNLEQQDDPVDHPGTVLIQGELEHNTEQVMALLEGMPAVQEARLV